MGLHWMAHRIIVMLHRLIIAAAWVWLIAQARGQSIGYQPTVYPSPGASGTPGSLCWREARANGTNTVCLSVPDAVGSNYTLKLPDATGTVGQALYLASTGQLGWADFAEAFPVPTVVRTSATRLTIGSNCSVASPCRWRHGFDTIELTGPETLDVSGGSATIEIVLTYNPSKPIHAGSTAAALTLTGSSGVAVNLSDPSANLHVPLYAWTATSGNWAATGTSRRLIAAQSGSIGTGGDSRLAITSTTAGWQIQTNLAATWRFTGIFGVPQAAPGTPQNGDVWYDTGANKFKCRQNGATTDCITTNTSSYPHDEVKITDYGAASDCSASINTAFANALAALPTDQGGEKSGIISFPAGCFAVDVSSGTAPLLISRAAGYGDVMLSGAGAGNEFAVVGAGTEIKVTSSAPATDTAIVEFRNALGGGIRNIQFNANGVAKTRIIKIRESRFGRIDNVQGRRWTSGPGLEFASETGATSGSCHWTITALKLGDVKDGDDASGVLFDGQAHNYSACSNIISGATIIYSKSGSTSYGMKFRYADNNSVYRTNVWASDCTNFPCESNFGSGRHNGTRPALTFEQYSTEKTFPKENYFQGTATSQPGYTVTGVSGTTGNVLDLTVDDCASPGVSTAGCFPIAIRNLSGRTPSGTFNGRNAVYFPHPDEAYPSWTLNNSSTSVSSAGRINFARGDRVRAAMWHDNTTLKFGTSAACDLWASRGARHPITSDHDTLTDIVVSGGTATATVTFTHNCTTANRIRVSESTTSALNGEYNVTAVTGTTISWATAASNGTYNNDGLTIEVAPKEWWNMTTAGVWTPASDGLANIGSSTIKPAETWSREYFSYTNAAFGTQDHNLQADNQINFYCDVYSASAAGDRCGFHSRRARGTLASPSNVTSGDRVMTIAGWGKVTSGFDAITRIDSYADTVSGDNITSSLRFATKSAGGSLTDHLIIRGTGGLEVQPIAFSSLPSSNNGTVIYCSDCTRATTCAGSGTGAFAKRLNGAWSCADASGGTGTVTSVAMSVPGVLLSVSGSPITTSGTLAVTLVTQSANCVFAGPTSGGAATPTCRSVVDNDIPDSITVSNYLPLAGGTMTGAITGATRYDSYSSSAPSHTWQTDTASGNLYLEQYSSGTSDRWGLNLRRARGTASSPSQISAGDRLGVHAYWAYTSSGWAAVSRIDSYADAYSAPNVTSSLRFAVANASTAASDTVYMEGTGGIRILTGSKPTCASGVRGTIYYVAGGGGVKDTFEVCGKDAADNYAWRTLY